MKLLLTAKTVDSKHYTSNHRPVLLSETVRLLNPRKGETLLDVTAGAGGHARAVGETVGVQALTLVDADPRAAAALTDAFAQATVYNEDFATQTHRLEADGRAFDMILADLGLSSLQLADQARGFSFRYPAPLDMRFNPSRGVGLAQRLRLCSVAELAGVIRDYGQERRAGEIAAAIKADQPRTAESLAELITSVKGGRRPGERLHPATRTFMALRIWVNDELEQLVSLLETAPRLLKNGGRLAIISFHSLEDRLVKRTFKELSEPGYRQAYRLKTKRPIVPDPGSLANHPQARSARLRAIERL